MKTTNFIISKQLKEAGFDAETDFFWYCNDNKQEIRRIADANGKDNIKSYDFKTILDALPVYITKEYKNKLYSTQLTIIKYSNDIYKIYYKWFDIGTQPEDIDFSFFTQTDNFSFSTNNESLADTVGRMWLELKKNKLI